MLTSKILLPALLSMTVRVSSAPVSNAQVLADPSFGPKPGQSSIYSTYYGKQPPFPANYTGAILNTTSGQPGTDDLLWQDLLAAEWIIYSFYQQGVELFNQSVFEDAGWPNTTYQRIMQIRDNEAGHLRVFQNQISSNSVKPGGCNYTFPFTNATTFLALLTDIEVSSMAFLTGLAVQAQLPSSKAALVAVAETESRHNTWSLIDVWNVPPFAGPTDTVYPYANQVLETTNAFIVSGSCPAENPVYPSPRQDLAFLSAAKGTQSIAPGATVTLDFTDPYGVLDLKAGNDYYAVFFHGVYNITMPFDTTTNSTTIPAEFEELGVIVAVIADAEGAPTRESVLAGPGIILEQPAALGLALASSG